MSAPVRQGSSEGGLSLNITGGQLVHGTLLTLQLTSSAVAQAAPESV